MSRELFRSPWRQGETGRFSQVPNVLASDADTIVFHVKHPSAAQTERAG
ncbi:MAG: hypothetical protein ISP10_00840 [Aeromicrobium sp.]|jgi:hypothetical protein|nr:hypothetical protein [Aeromicrobium sp.]